MIVTRVGPSLWKLMIQRSDLVATVPCSNDPVSVCAKALEEFVQQHGLTVPRDVFSSVAYQLTNVGHDVNASTLRQMCVQYLAVMSTATLCISQ